ncbi:nuclear transport factor 2 family protein [Lacinutrix iliipiscaria]|uniref:Nuclear transport factor 2 family protein n=1 Tax=Lacinutrix iliipiscaria TaxID=1230532 RepID=A0ABW5WNM8_9FLAO
MKKIILVIGFLFMSLNFSFSQEYKHLKEINTQVWDTFTKAFETFDYTLFSSIHSPNLIRISGDGQTIKLFSEYIEGYNNRWSNKNGKQTISFRFFERIANDEYASERGIYKLIVNHGTVDEKSYYGKFHVLIKREDNLWKLIMDYDSSEFNTINEASYNNAYAIDDFEKY